MDSSHDSAVPRDILRHMLSETSCQVDHSQDRYFHTLTIQTPPDYPRVVAHPANRRLHPTCRRGPQRSTLHN